MQNERHLVVEEPDGSVAIAFNQEVAAPPPPPPEMIGLRPQPRFRFLIEYHPVARALAYIFIIVIWYKFGSFHENNRYYQFRMLIVSTTGALHTEHSASITVIVFHGTCAGLMVVPFCVLRMWEQAIYQFSIAMMCMTAFNTCTQIGEEISEV